MPLASGKHRDSIPLLRFLDSNGDGTGIKDIIDDRSGGSAITLFIQPPEDEVYVLSKFILHLSDAGKFPQDKYGALAIALTVGLVIHVRDDDGIIFDLTNGSPIKTNDHFMHLGEIQLQEFGGIEDSLNAVFNAADFGGELILDGSQHQRLEVILNDNFAGLIDHNFSVRGFR